MEHLLMLLALTMVGVFVIFLVASGVLAMLCVLWAISQIFWK